MRAELPSSFKVVTVWLLVAVVLFLGVQWWQHRERQARFHAGSEVIEIRRGPDGQYHWPGRINGHAVDFLIDTGATGTAIPATLARTLKLDTLGSVQSNTAGGVVAGSVVVADIELQGGVEVQRLRLVALPGLIDRPLLGMDLLGRLHWQQTDGVLRIDLRSLQP
jgi:aspartyl protease family protein